MVMKVVREYGKVNYCVANTMALARVLEAVG
jgi:hypothetical protein